MISCKFQVSHDNLPLLENFLDELEIDNVSIFENTDRGFSAQLDSVGLPVANFFDVEILLENTFKSAELEKNLKDKFGNLIDNFKACVLKDENWVKQYIDKLEPVNCAGFCFFTEEAKDKLLKGTIPVQLNSALAFGSGHHQTTQSCILNMKHLVDLNFTPQYVLDMGCGTGILGICALKLWEDARLMGVDIDPEAVRITKNNYEINNIRADAFVGEHVPKTSCKFDLVLCNILKQPLIDLCDGFYGSMNSNSYIITSGFITTQEDEVMQRYNSVGFQTGQRIQMEDWVSIAFYRNDR